MSYTRIVKTIASSVAVSAVLLSFIVPTQSVFAQLQASGTGTVIQPSAQWMSPADSMTRSRFILNIKPGESLTRSITVSNLGNEEKRVIINPEDRLPNIPDFTFSDSEELKAVGTWIKLDSTDFLVGSQKAVTTNFTVSVPQGTAPGEYAGTIVMEEAPKEAEQGKSGFQLRSRVGTRVYVTVPGEGVNYGAKFNDFEFVAPGSKTYDEMVKGYYRQDPTVVRMNWSYQNIGKVFVKLKGNLTITGPNGQVKSDFDQDLNTFDEAVLQPGFPTNAKWVAGNYKARFEFSVTPVHKPNQDAKLPDVSPTKVVETEFNMTQDQINQIKKDFDALKNQRPEVNPAPEKAKADTTTVTEAKPETEVKKDDNNLYIILASVGGVILIALIGIIIFLVLKMKKDTEDKDEKKEDKSSKKSASKPTADKKDSLKK